MAREPPLYRRYEDFLDADPRRRRGDALELGADWRDGDGRYRVCWYEQTGELTFERLAPDLSLDPEDFHRGVAGPVEIVALIRDRTRLDRLLGEWPNVAVGLPRRLDSLRRLIDASTARPDNWPGYSWGQLRWFASSASRWATSS